MPGEVGKDPLVRPLSGRVKGAHGPLWYRRTDKRDNFRRAWGLRRSAQDRQEERSKMAGDANGNKTRLDEFKEQLVKAARMYAMCQKAGVAEPLDVTALAVAAFEDMPLKQSIMLVRSNEQNVKDLAWAFGNSRSAQEFEQRVKELRNLSGN